MAKLNERSVNCYLCKKALYYRGDLHFEPEFDIDVINRSGNSDSFTVHSECWQMLFQIWETHKNQDPDSKEKCAILICGKPATHQVGRYQYCEEHGKPSKEYPTIPE